MTALVKLQHKGQMTIPRTVRFAVGLADGDLVEIRTVGKKIVITPQRAIEGAKSQDREYTPAQRRSIDASLAEAEKGPYYGPFRNGTEIAAFLKKKQPGPKSAKSRKRR